MNTTNTGLTLFAQNTTELFKDEAKVAELAKPSFITTVQVLSEVLKAFKGVAGKNTAIPILEHVKIDISTNGVTFTGTDLETFVIKTVKLPTTGTGSLCLPYKLLSDYVSKCKAGNIVVKFTGTNDRAEIIRDTSIFGLQGMTSEDFPEAEGMEGAICPLTIQPSALSILIDKALPFAGTDTVRAALCAVKIEVADGEVRSIATDAHKLAIYRLFQTSDTYVRHTEEPIDMLIPSGACKVVQSLLKGVAGLVKVETSESYIRLSFGQTVVTCRQVEDKYPNYAAVIPSNNEKELTVNRAELIGAIKRVNLGANKSANQVDFKLNGVCHLSAFDNDFGSEVTETVKDFKYTGDPIEIGFNAKFLTEVLNRIDSERVTVLLKEPNRAALLLPHEISATDDYLTLIMPQLLNTEKEDYTVKREDPQPEEVEETEE